MDFCPGGNLKNHIVKHGTLSEQESIYFLKQLMNAFRELHKWSIHNRNFNIDNIFLGGDNIKIGDFGFTKMEKNRHCTSLGTPIIISPELF